MLGNEPIGILHGGTNMSIFMFMSVGYREELVMSFRMSIAKLWTDLCMFPLNLTTICAPCTIMYAQVNSTAFKLLITNHYHFKQGQVTIDR